MGSLVNNVLQKSNSKVVTLGIECQTQ